MRSTRLSHKFVFSSLGLVVLAIAASACGVLSLSEAEGGLQGSGGATPNSISVSGFGEAVGAPDIATVQLGVEVKDETISAAIERSNRTVARVRDAMLNMGIAETDLQSTNFNVWPEDEFDRLTGQPTGVRTYHVDSTLMVKVRDISQVSAVIQTGLDEGATNIWGLSFGIDDRADLEAEARAQALEDAQDRAAQLAEGIGVTLGEPMLVSELVGGGFSPFAMEAAAFRGMGGGGGPPLSPGELTVSIQVDVMYSVTR